MIYWSRIAVIAAALVAALAVPVTAIFADGSPSSWAVGALSATAGFALGAFVSLWLPRRVKPKTRADKRGAKAAVTIRGPHAYVFMGPPKRMIMADSGAHDRSLMENLLSQEITREQVVIELSRLEQAARTVLQAPDRLSIIRIRADLEASGLWSHQDLIDFDTALQVRNRVVHGDGAGVEEQELTDALATLKRLRQGLKAAGDRS